MLQLWIQQRLGGNVQPQGNAGESPDPFPRGFAICCNRYQET
jgi:hypothetical protein